jgi:hypothetical protein
MAISTKENSKMGRHMEKECINGSMERFTMASGEMELKKAMEYGKECLETVTLENGRIQRLMGMESISGKMETDMKENGKIVSNMDKALTYLQILIVILVLIKWVSLMAMDSISGRMVQCTLGISRMA